MRLTAAYEGLKRLNARRQTALREGAELIFWSHGPAAESRWPRLAMSGAHRKMFLATARRETSGSPFIFTRSKNRSDSPEQRALHPSNCSIPLAIASAILSRNASLKSICSSLAFVIKRHSTSALGIVDLRLT